MKRRLDQALVARGLVATRSQAESYIKLGEVCVNGEVVTKPGYFVRNDVQIKLTATEQYVSRAALKLASVVQPLGLDFKDKIVLDVGSSTGGFTDYALRHGAQKVIAVEVGTNQLHPSLRGRTEIELHEQTDIRQLRVMNEEKRTAKHIYRVAPCEYKKDDIVYILTIPDMVVIDVSFISLRDILPHITTLCSPQTEIIAMVKPQFESAAESLKHKGVIKNDHMRRDILKAFEGWVTNYFIIIDKADSQITGEKGNQERFYKLRLAR